MLNDVISCFIQNYFCYTVFTAVGLRKIIPFFVKIIENFKYYIYRIRILKDIQFLFLKRQNMQNRTIIPLQED